MPALRVATASERPDLMPQMLSLAASPWPEFLDHDAVVNAHWRALYELAPDFQFVLIDEQAASITAVGNCIPVPWHADSQPLPQRGVDAALEDGVALLGENARATAACALIIAIEPERLGTGLSGRAIQAMAEVAARHGLQDLVAPVRATEKHRYPLIPMGHYIHWRHENRAPFDAWIRVHERVGGQILGAASASMNVTGRVAEWERWTEMAFPESGAYVVPGALVPVQIDRENDQGHYQEPACWIRHRTPAA